MNKRIILIDDDESILEDYQMILSPAEKDISDLERRAMELEAELFGEAENAPSAGNEYYELTTALQGEEGYLKVKRAKESGKPFALAFIDIRMPPGWDGVETAGKIRQIDPDIEIVIVTAYSDKNRGEIVNQVGVPERLLYLKKPFDPDEIKQFALSLTRKWELERKSEKHRQYLEQLLKSLRRLKTLNISSVRDVLTAVLNEVLHFINANNGFIARLDPNGLTLEISSDSLSPEEIRRIIDSVQETIENVKSIQWLGNLVIFPLNKGAGKYYILVSDCDGLIDEEKTKLLRLLLETSSEVIENVGKQERFLRNERIATIGQIAAGIIHEVNNPLTAIMTAADLFSLDGEKLWVIFDKYSDILEEYDIPVDLKNNIGSLNKTFEPEKTRKKMSDHHMIIRSGAEQIRGLMANIRSFSKVTDCLTFEKRDVCEALEDTLVLAQNALKYGIEVHRNWTPPLLIRCDFNALKQVFLNLILNAVQAMEGVGEIWIEAQKNDDHIDVVISDSGPGIPEDRISRIFEAFYTTKEDGTGLGLSIVKGIIEKHGGTIRVETTPGRGATFMITLPVY